MKGVFMEKKFRLRKNCEFQHIYKVGKNYWNRNIILYKMKNNLNETRVGFTISKKIGNAVIRNKTKRRMREAYLRSICDLKSGYDLIFIPKKHIVDISFEELEKSIRHILKISGLLERDANNE